MSNFENVLIDAAERFYNSATDRKYGGFSLHTKMMYPSIWLHIKSALMNLMPLTFQISRLANIYIFTNQKGFPIL